MAATSKLSSLLERDESPPNAQASIDAIVSPVAPSNTFVPQEQRRTPSSAIETPQTASRFHVGLNEMHPSKVQQSTSKVSTTDADTRAEGAPGSFTAPAVRFSTEAVEKGTPTKSKGTLASHMSSPGFDFSFDRPESDLSADAQKIMEGVREQAAKIKARMQEERDKQQSKDGEAHQLYGAGGRKIAKAKGKSGRYSDVHKQQFRKMDSIVNHPSTWKNTIPANTTSLKRSGSKAGLDDPPQAKGLSKSGSSKSLRSVADTGRLENSAPGKRAKKHVGDDTSTTRPASQQESIADNAASVTSMPEAAVTKLPSAITTPTKASLARAASVKSTKGSMIPSLGRSNSIKILTSPAKSEGSNKYFSSLTKFGNVKSILSRHQPKFSNDPEKIAAGTHLPLPQGKVDLNELSQGKTDINKDLPNIPGAFPPSEERAQITKRVVFTPSTKAPQDLNISPTPSRIPALKSPRPVTAPSTPSDTVAYPSLVSSPNITHRPTKTPSASASPLKHDATPSPSKPTEFTFTSPRTLDFSAPASVSKLKFGPSTIRQVRPSGITTPLAPFDTTNIPDIAHGMTNKKRKHVDSDDEEDLENVAPGVTSPFNKQKAIEEEGEGPRAKKVKMTTTSERKGMATPQKSPAKKFGAGSRIPKAGGPTTTTPKGKGKSVLSLSRLNMLARPKDRR